MSQITNESDAALKSGVVKRFPDIFSILEHQAEVRSDAVAIESASGERVDYQMLHQQVVALGRGLRQRGIARGSRVAIVLPHGPDMAVALLGVSCAAVALPLNPVSTEQEFEAYLAQLCVDGVLLAKGADSPVRQAAQRLRIPLFELTLGFPNGPTLAGDLSDDPFDAAGSDDVALVLLTSGSTGAPKRVPLTHANICASIPEVSASMGLNSADRCLSMWEQFHVGGLVDLLMVPLSVGSTVICGTKFDVNHFFELLGSSSPTWFQVVPAALHEIVAHAKREGMERVDSSLRLIRSVASALPPDAMEAAETLFGVPVLQTFGMTEASPLITSTALPPVERKAGSVGRSFGTKVYVMDDFGKLLPTGEIGEVVVSGPNIMLGYEEDPKANNAAFRHGFFYTGDLGCFDEDGDLFLKGRIREMINRGGEKISPPELDGVLVEHPAILQAAAFPVPHRVLGEDVAVAIVLSRPGQVSAEEIREYLAERVSAFKIPQQIEFLEQLPLGATGKVSRRMLTEQYGSVKEGSFVAPRTNLERTLTEIWASALQLEQVGIDDNFFRLGGNSLSGVHMMTEVEGGLNQTLPVEALMQLNTVRSMAEAISQSDTSTEPVDRHGLPEPVYRTILGALGASGIPVVSPDVLMLSLNTSGTKPPLFWCFNRPGQIKKLAAVLGEDQPIYGLFSGGKLLEYKDEIHEQFATYYTEIMLPMLPDDGSYYMGGFCRGASVGGRVARNLTALGRGPAGLCLMDYFEPYLYDYPGRMLLLYGRKSRRRAFYAMNEFKWARPSWRSAFVNAPEVDWHPGMHGRFFRPMYIGALADRLRCLFCDEKPRRSLFRRLGDWIWKYIHSYRFLFKVYRRLARKLGLH